MMAKTFAFFLCCMLLFAGSEPFIPWNAQQKLIWDDFQGPADEASSSKAYTWTKISMGWECDGDVFKLTAIAKFDKARSWKKDVLTPALLAHEQLHFDITELYARKMRAHFASLTDACKLSTEEVSAQGQKLLDEWNARQKLYDKETAHSKIKDEQARWEVMVAKEIKALAKFAAP